MARSIGSRSNCYPGRDSGIPGRTNVGEAPDIEDEPGVGYDGYDLPEDFAANRQAAIWQEALAVPGSDARPPDSTSESIED